MMLSVLMERSLPLRVAKDLPGISFFTQAVPGDFHLEPQANFPM
jgi:hypothetical protein